MCVATFLCAITFLSFCLYHLCIIKEFPTMDSYVSPLFVLNVLSAFLFWVNAGESHLGAKSIDVFNSKHVKINDQI